MVTKNYFKNQTSRMLQWLAILSILLLGSFQAKTQNIMQVDDASVAAGGQVTISVNITNADPFVGFQLDIPIPDAASYVSNSAVLDPARSNGHLLSASLLSGNILRIIAFSINNTVFNGNSGVVASFSLNAGNIPGSHSLTIQNALIAAANSSNIMTGSQNGTLTIQAPNIQVSPSSQDFGSIPLGGTSEKSFTIQNTGNQNLSITAINFDNAYFENLGSSSFSLSPGQSQTVSVRFSAVVKGAYNNTMSIQSNDPDQPLTAVGLEAIAFAVNELHTGNMEAASGTQADLSFTINNMEDFVGFQFDLSLPSPLIYVEESGSLNAGRISDHQLSVSMVSSTSLRVIGLSPTNAPFSGDDGIIVTLSFDINGTGGWYPLNISNVIIGDINGDNVVSATYNGGLTITAPDIHANGSLGFGDVAVTATADQNFTLYNYGQETLTISNITFSNPVFSNLSTLPVTISSSQSSQIELHYDPTSSGPSSCTMRIYSDDPDENPFNVTLTANAFSPNYLTVQDQMSNAGSQATIQISAENNDAFVGFQFDITLPEGINYVDGTAILDVARKQDHTLSVTQLENGSLRLLSFSMTQQAFLGNEGTLVQFDVNIDETVESGNYPLTLLNATLGNSNSANILYAVNDGTLEITEQKMLDATIFLEGAFDGTDALQNGLNSAGLLSLDQPYEQEPWNYTGTEAVATMSANAVDWVLVELRQAASPELATEQTILPGWPQAMLLLNDGSIKDVSGESPSMGATGGDNLYIVIRHRNHLDVMSSAPLLLTENTYSYDFTDDITKAYGGASGYKAIGNSKYGMVAGDIDADGAVFASDFNIWAINFGLTTIYLPADLDMDGQIFASDFNKWAVNFGTNTQNSKNWHKYSSQVPNKQ